MHLQRIVRTVSSALLVTALGLTAVSCSGGEPSSAPTPAPAASTPGPGTPVIDPGDGGSYAPAIDPANFVATIDNQYMPLLPGARWNYEGTIDGANEKVEVVVTDERKEILGIQAVVVRDTVTSADDGTAIEITDDWFAQDRDGNVWYLGEASKDYENGQVVSTAGSWEAGVDGAKPGIVMQADPTEGDAYRQEFSPGEAEDLAEVIGTGQRAETAADSYEQVVVTREWTPLEPEVVEEKSYAPGIGKVLQVHTAGGEGRQELVSFTPGRQ